MTKLCCSNPKYSLLGALPFSIHLNDIFSLLRAMIFGIFLIIRRLLLLIKHWKNSRPNYEQIWEEIGKYKILLSSDFKQVNSTIEKILNFYNHFARNFLKINQIWSVQTRLAKLLYFDKKRLLFKTLFGSPFKYCHLVWIFRSRESNKAVNKRHLRPFSELPWKCLINQCIRWKLVTIYFIFNSL